MAHVHRDWSTPENRDKAARHPGKPLRLVAGSWISDMAVLGKVVMLCAKCIRRWKPAAYGYEQTNPCPGHRTANGECDGCGDGRVWPVPCEMYLPKR